MARPRPESARIRRRERLRTLVRMGTVALIAAVFVWLAVQFDPVQSSAQLRGQTVVPPTLTPKPTRGKLLGCLVGGAYSVRIHASADGPLYSIWDARTGKALAEDLSARAVSRNFPDLDPRLLRARPGADAEESEALLQPLMSAEQINEDP